MWRFQTEGAKAALAVALQGPCLVMLAILSPLLGQNEIELSPDDRIVDPVQEPLFSVGQVAGEAWQQFGTLTHAAFAPDGRLVLLDAQTRTLTMISGEGRFLGTVGRVGEGPGEFTTPSAMAFQPDGTLVVWDSRKRSLLRFGTDLGFIDETRGDYEAGIPGRPIAIAPDRAALAMARRLIMNGHHALLTDEGTQEANGMLPILHLPLRTGAVAVPVVQAAIPTWQGPGDPPQIRELEPMPSWGPLSDAHIALHHSTTYRVDIFDLEGRLVRRITRPIPPAAVDGGIRQRVRDRVEAEYRGGGVMIASAAGSDRTADDIIRERLNEMYIADVVPAISRIATDGAGVIWVERPDREDPSRVGWIDILGADGTYRGTLDGRRWSVPDAFGPDGLAVYLEAEGELEIPVARVVRLPAMIR